MKVKTATSKLKKNNLPITKVKDSLLKEIQSHQVVVIIAATGSGKTTQVPQFLIESGSHRIAVTQPRRIAAISIATRVAQEMHSPLGKTVGFAVRFQDKTTKDTRIKYMTDGLLLRELLTDPLLTRYSVIILDEAHERTLRTDILMGAIKRILKQRPDLKVIVMSATLNAKQFADYFG